VIAVIEDQNLQCSYCVDWTIAMLYLSDGTSAKCTEHSSV